MTDPPGKKALLALKAQNDQKPDFKVPALPRIKKKRKRQQVALPEEKYVSLLGEIIQRDFFPDLEKLKVQNDYLSAIERSDVAKVREIQLKYCGNKANTFADGKSPATFDTPSSVSNSTPGRPGSVSSFTADVDKILGDKIENTSKIAKSHSLDSFLTKYTSEDNDSFQNIIDDANEKLTKKLMELYKVGPLAIEAGPDGAEELEGPDIGMISQGDITNSVMFIPDGVELTKDEKLEMQSRQREVAYANTRFTQNPFNNTQNKRAINELAKMQAKKNLNGKVGVDGNILKDTGGENSREFDFLATPSPSPGGDCTPLMTWGEIEGTPFKLDGSDTPLHPSVGPSFRINETSKREMIAMELAEKAAGRFRDQKRKAIDHIRGTMASPHVRTSMEKLAILSPAAKRLATATLGIRPSSVTPKLRSHNTRGSTSAYSKATPSPMLVRKKTPLLVSNDLAEKCDATLTDNLLKIPSKRTKAADFF